MLYVSHINADNTISVKDSATKQITHIPMEQIRDPYAMIPSILGVFRYGSNVEIHEITWDNGSDCFKPILDSIQNDTIRMYADTIRHIIPPYIFEIPASSTGKYHPRIDLGTGGLKRHTLAVAKMFMYMMTPAYSKQMFTQDQIDCMLVACLMHDGLKMGWKQAKTTVFEHPVLMAKAIRGCQFFLDSQYVDFIAHCIESHMGQWNTSKYSPGVTLPVPTDKYQYFVHLADYLASRPDFSFTSLEAGPQGDIVNLENSDGKTPLTEQEVKVINKALQKITKVEIPIELYEKHNIGSHSTVVTKVWETLCKYRFCSDKQRKYLNLAKDYVNNKVVAFTDETTVTQEDKDIIRLALEKMETTAIPNELWKKYGADFDILHIVTVWKEIVTTEVVNNKTKPYLDFARDFVKCDAKPRPDVVLK